MVSLEHCSKVCRAGVGFRLKLLVIGHEWDVHHGGDLELVGNAVESFEEPLLDSFSAEALLVAEH